MYSLRNTHLCGARNDSGEGAAYSLEGVQVLCDALVHRNCVLECLDVSDNGIKVRITPLCNFGDRVLECLERQRGQGLASQLQ